MTRDNTTTTTADQLNNVAGNGSEQTRAQLLQRINDHRSPRRLVIRAQIVLLTLDGLPAALVAARLRISRASVRMWWRRFSASGVGALDREAPGRGRPRGMSHDKVEAVFHVLRLFAAEGLPWSTRRVAARSGVSAVTAWRIARRYHLTPASTLAEIDEASHKAFSETRRGAA